MDYQSVSTSVNDGWPGVARTALCVAGSVLIAWHRPEHAGNALDVILVLAAPGLARAFVAPVLARILRPHTPKEQPRSDTGDGA